MEEVETVMAALRANSASVYLNSVWLAAARTVPNNVFAAPDGRDVGWMVHMASQANPSAFTNITLGSSAGWDNPNCIMASMGSSNTTHIVEITSCDRWATLVCVVSPDNNSHLMPLLFRNGMVQISD
jgi:hypothetical protein